MIDRIRQIAPHDPYATPRLLTRAAAILLIAAPSRGSDQYGHHGVSIPVESARS
jgi:hypothetical protein